MIERNEEVEYANTKCGQMGNLMNEHCLKSFPRERRLKKKQTKKTKTKQNKTKNTQPVALF